MLHVLKYVTYTGCSDKFILRCFHLGILHKCHVVIVADSEPKVCILTWAVLIMMFKQTLMIAFDISHHFVLEDWKHYKSAVSIYNFIGLCFYRFAFLSPVKVKVNLGYI
jgi:hypothetical protein